MVDLISLGKRAKAASRVLSCAGAEKRNGALRAIAAALRENAPAILKENGADMAAARERGMTKAFLDRLQLSGERIEGIAAAVEEIVMLQDPVGVVESGRTLENGIRLVKTKVPFGVVGMIYEARPNVTVDAAALCLKSGNVCLLRGSKEAIRSNIALANVMRGALDKAGLPGDCILLVEDTTRESANAMMTLNGYLDLLIPRGGAGLIRTVVENATVPVIETGVGNCHTYIDAHADLEMAVRILDNAKTSRPSVCNACETVLVHRDIAGRFLPAAKAALAHANVEWRGDARSCEILPGIKEANETDWETEYGDYILACRVVENMEEALLHIARYSSGHSECIVTESYESAEIFTARVDAAAVYVNASTRFTDGGVFGLGAEIGISTQKLHIRGPMGLRELTTDKYILFGSGQVR
ncbi:glutamate-5-semialdehyde dehydrogenase [Provencibacterium massiliense]|uniref:glutamate-5-semialdehyde dehydrogenase n=1 Tax=Provencibacterium massiliense TaxID=1841868 RepID=UPI0009A8966B|nr:glutamate-5-semialdehyde dehydrogenase [Provencibacterium massiliense]RGB66995.1 glutamate-5-semialdehyde dehydrogenase [Harryflintia acetispora]